MNGEEWSLFILCIIGVCLHLWGIYRVISEQQISRIKNILLLNSLVNMMIIDVAVIVSTVISLNCFIPQSIIVFSLTISLFFQTWQLIQEYIVLSQNIAVFHKKQPSILIKALCIYCFAISIGLLSGFESEDISELTPNTSTCFDFINSPLLNSKLVLSITQVVPLSIAVLFTVVLIFCLTVRLQRKHRISFSFEKIMLPIVCLVADFCVLLAVVIQLQDRDSYDGSRKDIIRQLGIFVLAGATVIHPIVQFQFNKVKNLPVKRFQSFSSNFEDGSQVQNAVKGNIPETKHPNPMLQRKFLSDDEHDLPAQQANILKNPVLEPPVKSIFVDED